MGVEEYPSHRLGDSRCGVTPSLSAPPETLPAEFLRGRLSILLLPLSIVLRNFSLLQLLPGFQCVRPGCVLFASQKIREKIYVSARRSLRETALHLIQSHILSHQVAVGDLDAIIDLLLSPTVESVASPRFPF